MSYTEGGIVRVPTRREDLLGVRSYGQGIGTVRGTVKVESNLASRRVRLYERKSGVLVEEVWSDAVTGEYAFYDIPENKEYMVVGMDYTRQFNAVVADGITPET